MNYEEALDFIYKRQLFGMKFGLDNISALLKAVGDPQETYKCIHVAGTNGKGSVCSMLAQILSDNGYRVGLYTSPHLVDFRERMQCDGLMPKRTLVALLERIIPHLKDQTFFELATALAFMYFRDEKVDFAIIEVGLGGRLDATNVLNPLFSIITDIGLDHQNHLGKSVDEVAVEKAGIIKPGKPVITLADNAALKTIAYVADEVGSEVLLAKPSEMDSGLQGSFQKRNIGLAVRAAELISDRGYKVQDVEKSVQNAYWPGRMDYVRDKLLFDCAHNVDGAAALRKELDGNDCVIVLGIMSDKDIKGMCDEFNQAASEFVVCRPDVKRAADPQVIADCLTGEVSIVEDVGDAIEYASLKNKLIVVAGSIFTVGEAFEKLSVHPFDR